VQFSPYSYYSFGIAAVASCKDGLVFNSTISTVLNSALGVDDIYIGFDDGLHTLWLTDKVYPLHGIDLPALLKVEGSIGGVIDCSTDNGVFKPRKVTSSANPPPAPSMATGEWIIYVCSAITQIFDVYYDGSNKFYKGVNWSSGAFVGGINLF
jgi:hypothetical protein